MRTRQLLLGSSLLLALAIPAAAQKRGEAVRAIPLPTLSLEELDVWRDAVRPTEKELGAEAIDWIADFAEGVRESSRARKPLLFWAMNGHPLGCT